MWRRHRQLHCVRSMERLADSSNSFLIMFSYMDLKIATRNFRSKLGSGGFSTVFKGYLIDGTVVAVKKMEGSRQDEKQFRAEVSSLGIIQHANLTRLRGFCAEGSRRFLIYDYMPNGSLNSLVFTSNSKSKQKILDWKKRFEIALDKGIAEERDLEEVRRASIVGLLCIEKDEELRPSMGQVVLMLEGKIQPQITQTKCFALMDKQADRSDTHSGSDN
ncbi:hypothetical protein SUGI_0663550 [Cryptomeria japonica]|nr:hypothetical protein SUGI_0663550 [Cryptomeria japonica]